MSGDRAAAAALGSPAQNLFFVFDILAAGSSQQLLGCSPWRAEPLLGKIDEWIPLMLDVLDARSLRAEMFPRSAVFLGSDFRTRSASDGGGVRTVS